MDVEEAKASVLDKISRGGFLAAFFVTSMKAIGMGQSRIEDV
jgi:hypothetical protein